MRVLLALMAPLAATQQTLSPLFQTTSPVLTTATVSPYQTGATTLPALSTSAPYNVATVTPVVTASTATATPGAAPTSGWSGCDDPATLGEPIKIGKKTTVCVVLANNADWNPGLPGTKYLRLSFQPIADEYSRFTVPSCKSSIKSRKRNIVLNE
jgi:hypothetical protein